MSNQESSGLSEPNPAFEAQARAVQAGPKSDRLSIRALLPAVIVAVAASTVLSAAMFWVLSSSIKEDLKEQQASLKREKREIRGKLAQAESTTSKLLDNSKSIRKELTALKEEKLILQAALTETTERLGRAHEGLVKVTNQISGLTEDQGKVDAGQNAEITKVSNRVTYIERRVKSLEALEVDVMSLKNDTGNLKGQYVTLKQDLEAVREKGDVTHQELETLGERSRLFQLRVLKARAQEAAEAARKVDIKKLLARLAEEE